MRYLVDLEKKEIVYDEDMPAGHMIALKKIFEEKGFRFFSAPSIETMDEFNKKMKDEFGKHVVFGTGEITGPVGPKGIPGIIGVNLGNSANSMNDMMRQEEARLRQREHEERDRWMRQMTGLRDEYYSPDGRVHGSKEEMESYMRTKYFNHEAHPANKSNAELRYEASKIKEEVDDVQKVSRLKESLEKLKSKLGFL